jgi:hypothetical protein
MVEAERKLRRALKEQTALRLQLVWRRAKSRRSIWSTAQFYVLFFVQSAMQVGQFSCCSASPGEELGTRP